jgi:iron complex transport system ATP-binding protein
VTLVLEARGVSVGWGGRSVLAGVELCLFAGERFALVGANGSGKTTLLRALGGLTPTLAGSIRWLGQALPHGRERVGVLGLLLQSESPSRFSVRELVTLGLALDGPPSSIAEARVQAALDWSGLTAFAERPCQTLSGGESQRALLARAWVAEPRLMLLDEPTNHLDPAHQADLLSRLDELRGKTAVLLSTHDLSLAASCDRVALLHGSGLDSVGSPDEVLTPARLERCLGAQVRRMDDPQGGPPFFRVLPPRRAPEPAT